LSAVGLPTDGSPIKGVYDGEWRGSGSELLSKCPATGETLGRVLGVRVVAASATETALIIRALSRRPNEPYSSRKKQEGL
jgi:hypothetical protein